MGENNKPGWEVVEPGLGAQPVTHSPKKASLRVSQLRRSQPRDSLAIQKFSIQGMKVCYGVAYGTTSANILHFQMFRELQKC